MFNRIPTKIKDMSIQTLKHDLAKLKKSPEENKTKIEVVEREIDRRNKPISKETNEK